MEDESARANALMSRGDMEGVMVVHLAGRSAEKLVMGEGEVRGRAAFVGCMGLGDEEGGGGVKMGRDGDMEG